MCQKVFFISLFLLFNLLVSACSFDPDFVSTLAVITPEPGPEPIELSLLPMSTSPSLTAVEIFDTVSPAIVFIDTPTGTGSGILIDNGYIVSNAHVVWPHEIVRVVFADGSEYLDTPVVAWDMVADLAILGPVDTSVRPINFVNADELVIGSDVFLIGYPAELEDFPQPTITHGLLSRIREWETIALSFLQVDAAITGGQSGGALVTEQGELLGISTFYFSSAGFGLVSSATDIVPRLEALLNQTGNDVSVNQRRLLSNSGLTEHQESLQDEQDTKTYLIDEPVGTEIEIGIEGKGNPQFIIHNLAGYDFIKSEDRRNDIPGVSFVMEYEGPYLVTVYQLSQNEHTFHLLSDHPLMPYHDPDDEMVLNLGETYLANIDYPYDVDSFEIALDKGDIVEITMDSLRIDAHLSIHYESVALEETIIDDDSGGGIFDQNAQLIYQAPVSQTYVIKAENSYGDETGAYYISVKPAQPDAILTEAQHSQTFIASPYGRLTPYESEQNFFRILYPAHWSWSRDCGDQASACFSHAEQGGLVILEEDMKDFQSEEMNLTGYVDLLLDILEFSAQDFDLLSREPFTTPQGIVAEVLAYQVIGGRLQASRLVFVDDQQIAFNVTYYVRSDIYERMAGMVEYSFKSFRVLDPETQEKEPIYYYDKGLRLVTARQFDEAIDAYTKAIELNPDLRDAYVQRAAVHRYFRDYDLSIADLNAAIALNNESAELYHERALTYWIAVDYESAKSDIDTAIAFDPDDDHYYNIRALINASMGAYEDALADIAIIERKNDGHLGAHILDTRGYIYIKMADFEKAKEDFDEIFDRDLRFPYALLGGGITYTALGETEAARKMLEDGLLEVSDSENPDPQLTDLINLAEEALETLE